MTTPRTPLEIDGNSLTLEAIREVALRQRRVSLSEEAVTRIDAAREVVEEILRTGQVAYGVNTGFGNLAEVRIDDDALERLQLNLLRSHAVGVGAPLSIEESRALLLLRANVLAKGVSGIRRSTVEALLALLEADVIPVVPSKGSVGASGDLAPLAHLALVLVGEGEAHFEGERLPGDEALARAGLEPVTLAAKEGLCLVNGTQAMAAVGTLTLLRAEGLAEAADESGAMTVEALLGSHKPFREEVQAIRPHPGQAAVAAHLRELLAGSQIVESHHDCDRVQDAYSLRCMPQVHGAARDALAFVRRTLEIEVNSGTDNPLVFVGSDDPIVSGGNFHGQYLAQALDLLAIAVSEIGAISERRIEQIVNPSLSHLPAFLAPNPGLDSGMMMAQVTAAALVAENKVLAHPASVDSIPSSAGREDHVSMGMTAALKAREIVENTRGVLAIELLCAAQALDLRSPLKPGGGVARVHALIRAEVPTLTEDRALGKDIAKIDALLRERLI
ncbi:MAG: histidine ammonia-lyase [Deltaproteobacteria bacterium]|nr:histidine ammonia-lyase [Deltaproteobacteria bacterium]